MTKRDLPQFLYQPQAHRRPSGELRTCTWLWASSRLRRDQVNYYASRNVLADSDHNPDLVMPRSLFDIALGTDNLFRTERTRKIAVRFTLTNVTNKVALYSFLSTFSGTHFVAPRTSQVSINASYRSLTSRHP
jgi:hypothetical protein